MDVKLVHERISEALSISKAEFGNFFLLKFLGFEVTYGDDVCTVYVPTAEHMLNPQGTLHGGIIATAVDISMGHLCNHVGARAVTVDVGIKFLRPLTGPVWCVARFLKRGRTLHQMESRVLDEDGRLCAHATATWFRVPDLGDGS